MLADIIQSVADRTGLDVSVDRNALIKLVNAAAKELWEIDDLPLALRECVVLVDSGQQIVLPAEIGELKGVRELDTLDHVSPVLMQSRYSHAPWREIWNHWRLKNVSPVFAYASGATPIKYCIPYVEDAPISITVSGSTNNSQRVQETITLDQSSTSLKLDATEVQGSVVFDEIHSITQNGYHQYDISLKDLDGNVLAILKNNERKTAYQIVDISLYPFRSSTDDPTRYVEILYKPRLAYMYLDGDEFPAPNMEDALYYKAMEVWSARQKDNTNEVLAYRMKCGKIIESHRQSTEGSAEARMLFAPSPYFGLFRHGLHSKRFFWWNEFNLG